MKYSIDYYQREYKWGTKQVTELIEDLTLKFLEDYDKNHVREAVANYGHYFLGSIVISDKNGHKFIIDGQQRLTTLTLLLIYLNNLQRSREDAVDVVDLIFSVKYGKKSFNLDVPERTRCMDTLFNQEPFDDSDQPEFIRNIVARYENIESVFPIEIKDETLPYFMDWLIENVHMVEITAYSDEDAYTIFETMNDRGLSLSPTDMLKGYLLANITDEAKRLSVNAIWKQYMGKLAEIGSDETADFFKTWLRSQYASSIRERKKGAKPEDFDRIGTEFHRWVRERKADLGLERSDDFQRFIEQDMAFYARQYQLICQASQKYTSPLEDIFHITQYGFTLQYPVLLSPLRHEDDEDTIKQKLRIMAAYIDILLTRRLWNWHSIAYSTMQYAMFLVMRDVRGKSPDELMSILQKKLASQEVSFTDNDRFSMHKMNRYVVHRILARMTDYVERKSGLGSHYLEYVGATGQRYEVEHIWANHAEWHLDEFIHPTDFGDYRSRIGGLLLLPKSFNSSYGDLPYKDKLEHYFSQNLLARSLHPKCYEHNPGFLDFITATKLPFKPHPDFKKIDLDERQALYTNLAEQVWSSKAFGGGVIVSSVSRWPPYPAYRPSGLPWLGDVPAYWEVKQVKRIFIVTNGSTPNTSIVDFWDGDIVWITPEDLGQLQSNTIYGSARRITRDGYQSCGTILVPPGSLVLSTRAPIGHMAIAGVELCTNQGCRCLVFRRNGNSRFFYYQFLPVRPELESYGRGSTFKELGKSELEAVRIVCPPLPEQQAIITFLDHQTSHLDALIAKNQRLIELLQEKRAALISQAVTKGLNPDVPKKDLGLAWLGKVPSHWDVDLVKRHFQIDLGKMLDSSKQPEDGELKPYLRAANIYWDGVWLDDVNEMKFTKPQLKRYRLQKGDLLVTEGGVTVGRSVIWQGELDECYYQNSINRARPNSKVPTKFLYYWLYSLKLDGFIDIVAEKATFGHLTKDKLEVLPMTVPPESEAINIIEFLDKKLEQIWSIEAKINSAIEKLREYRTALISAAVTGKIDVRNRQA